MRRGRALVLVVPNEPNKILLPAARLFAAGNDMTGRHGRPRRQEIDSGERCMLEPARGRQAAEQPNQRDLARREAESPESVLLENVKRRVTHDVGNARRLLEKVGDAAKLGKAAVDNIGPERREPGRKRGEDDTAKSTGRVLNGAVEALNVKEPLRTPLGLDVMLKLLALPLVRVDGLFDCVAHFAASIILRISGSCFSINASVFAAALSAG